MFIYEYIYSPAYKSFIVNCRNLVETKGEYYIKENDACGISVVCISIVLGLLGIGGIDVGINEKDYKKIKVIVEDTVSYNDFTSRYEVIDQDGDIWIVKEKE